MTLSACVSPVAEAGRPLCADDRQRAGYRQSDPLLGPLLVCMSEYAREHHLTSPRIAVGRISDYTGKEESDGSGRKLTQGASLMAISALAKSGASLVERYDTSVSELELKYANNKLISGRRPHCTNAERADATTASASFRARCRGPITIWSAASPS